MKAFKEPSKTESHNNKKNSLLREKSKFIKGLGILFLKFLA